MKIYIFVILTLLVLISTVHAQPITNFNIVNSFPTQIIGGNLYNMTVTYDSLNVDAVFNFTLLSPYILWNNTPEIAYFLMVTDGNTLSCYNQTDNDTILYIYCPYHLNNGHHNTIVYYRLAPNIMPGNYGLEFRIHTVPTIAPTVTKGSYSGSGSGSSITKVCSFKVMPIFENVTTKPVFEEPDDVGGISIDEPKKQEPFVNDTKINDTEIHEDDEELQDNGLRRIIVIIIGLLCITFVVYFEEIKQFIRKYVGGETSDK